MQMVGPATNRNGVKPEFAIDASYICDELGQKFGRDKISSIFCAEDDVSELQGVGVRHRLAIARPGFAVCVIRHKPECHRLKATLLAAWSQPRTDVRGYLLTSLRDCSGVCGLGYNLGFRRGVLRRS